MVEWNNLLEGKLSGKLIPDNLVYKRKTVDNDSLSTVSVIRLGLEPRTPTLKVLCSTC